MLIVTRYKASKLTGITEPVFLKMWVRHQEGLSDYGFFYEDGKIDVDSESFQLKYGVKINIKDLETLRDKIENKSKKKPVKKTVKKKPEEKGIPESKPKQARKRWKIRQD